MRLLDDPYTPIKPFVPTRREQAAPPPPPLLNFADGGQQQAPAPMPMGAPQQGGSGWGDILQGIGMSLMSSPRNAPLANFPQFYGALQQASQERQKSEQEAQALEQVFRQAGVPGDMASTWARNPAAAKFGWEWFQGQQAQQADQSFMQSFPRADGEMQGTQAAPAAVRPALPDGVAYPEEVGEPAGVTAQPSTSRAMPTYEEARAALSEGDMPQPEAQRDIPLMNPQFDNLMKVRQQMVDRLAAAPSDRARKAAEAQIANIDKRLDAIAPTNELKNYIAEQIQNQEMGNPVVSLDDWHARRAERTRPLTNVNVGGQQSPGWRKIDENFAEEYVRWQGGGFADAAKQLDQLGEALTILESGENVTGAIGAVPEVLQPFINERGTVAREAVEEVVQRNLREILGAQFTEREGERLIARAFNPRLPPQENAKRLRRLIDQVGGMAQAKQSMVDYFNENGTLQGYQGARPNVRDLETIDFGDGPGQPQSGGQSGRGGRVEIDGYVIEEID